MKIKDAIVYGALALLVINYTYEHWVKEDIPAPDYLELNREYIERLETIESSYKDHDEAIEAINDTLNFKHEQISTAAKPELRDMFDDFRRRTSR